jgi:hypothetical protein
VFGDPPFFAIGPNTLQTVGQVNALKPRAGESQRPFGIDSAPGIMPNTVGPASYPGSPIACCRMMSRRARMGLCVE